MVQAGKKLCTPRIIRVNTLKALCTDASPNGLDRHANTNVDGGIGQYTTPVSSLLELGRPRCLALFIPLTSASFLILLQERVSAQQSSKSKTPLDNLHRNVRDEQTGQQKPRVARPTPLQLGNPLARWET